MQINTTSAQETKSLAKAILTQLRGGDLLRLDGDLGAGKTTFTQGLGKGLGIKRAVKSPTYTIVKNYPVQTHPQIKELVHIDAYRLEDGGADTVDLDSFFGPDRLIVMEWAEFVEDYLPQDYLLVKLNSLDQNQRVITIQEVGNFKLNFEKLAADYKQELENSPRNEAD